MFEITQDPLSIHPGKINAFILGSAFFAGYYNGTSPDWINDPCRQGSTQSLQWQYVLQRITTPQLIEARAHVVLTGVEGHPDQDMRYQFIRPGLLVALQDEIDSRRFRILLGQSRLIDLLDESDRDAAQYLAGWINAPLNAPGRRPLPMTIWNRRPVLRSLSPL